MNREIVNQLSAWTKSKVRRPLVITGVRGCGKKYTLLEFGKTNFEKVYHINFEEMVEFREVFSGKFDPNRILDEVELYFGAKINMSSALIVLSEIQRCPGIIDVIISFARMRSRLAICCIANGLDINSYHFLSLQREIINLQMRPMTFREFIAAMEDKKAMRIYQNIMMEKQSVEWSHSYLNDLFRYYLVVGGMPEAVLQYKLTKNFKKVRQVQSNIVNELFKDIECNQDGANANHMKSVITNMAKQMRDCQGGRVGKFSFKGVLPGSSARLSRIQKPIEWLKRQGIILTVNVQNNIEQVETLEKNFKIYFFDVGILSLLMELEPEMLIKQQGFKGLAPLLENHVVLALNGEDEKLFCWRGTNAEISLIRDLDGAFIPNDVRDQENLKAKNIKAYCELHSPDFVIKTTDRLLNIDRKKREVNLPYYLAEFEW